MYYYDEETGTFIDEKGSDYTAANTSGDLFSDAGAQVIVYGPDGTVYGTPRQAENAGVSDYTYTPPRYSDDDYSTYYDFSYTPPGSSEENVFDDAGYSDANGAMVKNADGTFTYKTWAQLDEIAGVPAGTTYDGSAAASGVNVGAMLSKLGTSAYNALKNTFTDPKTGDINWRNMAAAAGGLYGLYQSQNQKEQPKTGYQGKIPQYEAVRERVANTYDPNRRPGSTAQNYFSGTKFVAPEGAEAARTAAREEAAGLEALNRINPARQERPVVQAAAGNQAVAQPVVNPASSVINTLPVPTYASGGIAEMARGRYLGGATDGMADKIPARIGGKQEARLSHGEFVIPADVVGHLGNGNSEAGAQRLYAMMDKIRKARTGTTKQGKQINPDKFLA